MLCRRDSFSCACLSIDCWTASVARRLRSSSLKEGAGRELVADFYIDVVDHTGQFGGDRDVLRAGFDDAGADHLRGIRRLRRRRRGMAEGIGLFPFTTTKTENRTPATANRGRMYLRIMWVSGSNLKFQI